MNLQDFKKQLDEWTSEEGVTYEFVQYQMKNNASGTSPDDKWWQLFSGVFNKL